VYSITIKQYFIITSKTSHHPILCKLLSIWKKIESVISAHESTPPALSLLYSPQWDVDLGRLHISQLFTSDVFRKVQWGHVHFAWTPLEELAPAFTLPEATLPGLRPQTRI
jgi:hypothetical protein